MNKSSHSLTLPSLKRNVAWTMLGNVVYSACQWAMLVIIARMGSQAAMGQFALALAVTGPIVMLANLQLRWVQATDRQHEFRFANYMALRLCTTCAAFVVVVVISRILGYHGLTLWIIIAMASAKCFESISDVIYGWYQQNEQMKLVSRSLMVRGVVSVSSVAITYWLTGTLLLSCWALAISWLVVLVGYDLPLARRFSRAMPNDRLGVQWSGRRMLGIASRALPVGLIAGANALEAAIPRYVVDRQLGASELGVFAAMASVLMAGYMVIQSVNASALPRLAKYAKDKNHQGFRDVVKKLVFVAAVIGGLMVAGTHVAGETFLRLVYGNSYAQQPMVFTLIMVACAAVLLLRPSEVALLSIRRFWSVFAVHLIGLPLLSVVAIVSVSRFGLVGAAYAMIVHAVVHGLMVMFVLWTLRGEFTSQQNVPNVIKLTGSPVKSRHSAHRSGAA